MGNRIEIDIWEYIWAFYRKHPPSRPKPLTTAVNIDSPARLIRSGKLRLLCKGAIDHKSPMRYD